MKIFESDSLTYKVMENCSSHEKSSKEDVPC